jgi:hypothetical protein
VTTQFSAPPQSLYRAGAEPIVVLWRLVLLALALATAYALVMVLANTPAPAHGRHHHSSDTPVMPFVVLPILSLVSGWFAVRGLLDAFAPSGRVEGKLEGLTEVTGTGRHGHHVRRTMLVVGEARFLVDRSDGERIVAEAGLGAKMIVVHERGSRRLREVLVVHG